MSRLTAAIKSMPYWLLAALVGAFAFYCVNAIHFAKQPLRIEESEWPTMAKAIYDTGRPVTEIGDTNRLRLVNNTTVDRSPRFGAWHPPLYLYTLAASMTVLGTDSPYRLRLVGVVGLLLSIVLLFVIAREITPRWRIVGGVAGVLALIHPLAIQDSVFLDIDSSIYMPLALLVVWLAIRYGRRPAPLTLMQVFAIGGAIALVTWAKMTTTIDVLGALVIWWLLFRRPFRQALLEAAAFVCAGLSLFFLTYGLWCALTDIPFSYTFDVTFIEKSNRLFSNWLFVDHAAHWHLRWFSASVFLLGLAYLIDLARSFFSERRLRAIDLPFLMGGAILVQYVLVSPTDGTYQGKYAFPALLMLLLPISWMLFRKPLDRRPAAHWVAAVALGLIAAVLIPDLLTGLTWSDVGYGSWAFELRVLAGAGAALMLVWWLAGKRGFAGGVIVVAVALLIAQAVHSYRADTSPMYPIPDTADFNAAINDLNQNMDGDDIVIAVKDIGFYFDGTYIDGEEAFVGGDRRLIRLMHREASIAAFARDSFGPPVGVETEAYLSRCFTDQHLFGTASVVYRKGRCQ
jgi:hypothetical protein